jgi:adhesin transport system outer membrane protein
MPRPLCKPLVLAITAALTVWPVLASANCDQPPEATAALIGPPPPDAPEPRDAAGNAPARQELEGLTRAAITASAQGRAAEHQLQAASHDLDQIRAQRLPNLSFSGSPAAGEYTAAKRNYGFGGTGTGTVLLSAPLYDGGRLAATQRYREQLLEANASSLGAVRERTVADALTAAFERDRNRDEVEVQRAHVARLSCLSQMIDRIVAVDPGRASEQVQARKTLRESRLSLEGAELALRRAELRLQRLVGQGGLPSSHVGRAFIDLPALELVLTQVEGLPEIRRLRQQAEAQEHLATAAAAERKPQIRWEAGVTAARSAEQYNYHSWRTGLMINYTLFDFGAQASAADAARERARAARQELEQALTDRRNDAQVLHDSARTAYQRALHLREVLRDSDQLVRATYRQWAELGRRSLFDLISAESEHAQVRRAYLEAMYQGYEAGLQLRQLGGGVLPWVAPDLMPSAPSALR